MKSLVIGYGSIGQRHARLLEGLNLEIAIVSRRDVKADKLFSNISAAINQWSPDYVVVASATYEHRDDFEELADCGFKGTILIEKPLFCRDDNVPFHEFKNVYVAYNLRFHPVFSYFRELLLETIPYAVHAYVGQYLPDWRPESDYRKGYSAFKARGGGVLRDLSHELDALNWMLGGWIRMAALGGHFSDLEIDSEDVFSIIFESKICPVTTIQMNYLDSKLNRTIVALTDKGTISANLAAGTVSFGGKTKTFTVSPDDTYIAQHRAIIEGEDDVLCTLEQGLQITKMIDAAELAAAEKKWVVA